MEEPQAVATSEESTDVCLNMKISRGETPESFIDMDELGNMQIYNEFGQQIRFGELYKTQKTIVILIRNFLCFMTKEYVDDLALIPPHFLTEANVRLVIIGCGPHKFIKDFKKDTSFQYEMYSDPDRELFKKLQCLEHPKREKLSESKHVKSGFVLGILKSVWRGMKHREYQGNMDQQGGSFIFEPDNVISYQHIDKVPSDHTPINELLSKAGVEQVAFEKDSRIINL